MSFLDRLVSLGSLAADRALVGAEGLLKSNGATAPAVEEAKDRPGALFWDPFSVVEQLGYKEKPSAITYGTLLAMVWRVPLVQAILVTRINQVASFARPQRDLFQTGFRVKLLDSTARPSAVDRKYISRAEDMLMTTGVTNNPIMREPFERFLRKATRDSLTFDQMCFEVVKNRKNEPAAFYAVDASTIRLADTVSVYFDEDAMEEDAYTVQIYDGMVIREWKRDEMAFCIRNPSTSIRNFGYGISEMEMLVNAITSFLWGFEYNSRFFHQGSGTKGILNIKGPINQRQLDGFRRQWYQMISGVENAWRTPVLNSEEVQFVSMSQSNRDMEFSAWMDFLIKLICAIFQMDPIELNFKYGNAGQQRTMFEAANKQKLMESKDKGLKPLLRFIARQISNYVIRPINPDFELEFVGLEAQTQDDLAKLNQQRVKTTHTVNELRAEYDLPPLEGGDTILDPVYLQALQTQKMAEQGGMPGMGGSDQQQAGDFNNDGTVDQGAVANDFSEEDFEALAGDEGGESPEPTEKALIEFEF